MNYITKNHEFYESLPNYLNYSVGSGLYSINNILFKTMFIMNKPLSASEIAELIEETWGITLRPRSIGKRISKFKNYRWIEWAKVTMSGGGGYERLYTVTPYFYNVFKVDTFI